MAAATQAVESAQFINLNSYYVFEEYQGSNTVQNSPYRKNPYVTGAATFDPIFDPEFSKAEKRLSEVCRNDRDSELPNEAVKKVASKTLELLKPNKMLPSLINPTGDESLIFEFFINEDLHLIEFYNSGEIVYAKKTPNQPTQTKEISQVELRETIQEIIGASQKADVRRIWHSEAVRAQR